MPISIDTERFREKANPKTEEELLIVGSIETKVRDWEHPEKYLTKPEQAYLIAVYEKSHKTLEDENKKFKEEVQELVKTVAVLQDDKDILLEDIQYLVQATRVYFNSGNLPLSSRLGAV